MKFRLDESFGLSKTFRLDPLLDPEFVRGGTADWMKVENRSPISRAFRGGRGCEIGRAHV